MSPIATFRIPDDLLDGLREVQDRDGVTVAEQVRRAIRAWLAEKGIELPPKPVMKRPKRLVR